MLIDHRKLSKVKDRDIVTITVSEQFVRDSGLIPGKQATIIGSNGRIIIVDKLEDAADIIRRDLSGHVHRKVIAEAESEESGVEVNAWKR